MVVVFDQPFQILLELVQTHRLDPWDIDIEKLTNIYLQRIREMRELDLRISGRALLCAAILLRMKSGYIDEDGHAMEAEEDFDEDIDLNLGELGPLVMIHRTPRKITLNDLISMLQEVLREAPRGGPKLVQKPGNIVHELSEYSVNIEKMLDKLYRRIIELAPNGKEIKLTELLDSGSRIELVRTFLLALFLSSQGKINLRQDEPFGDIFISLAEPPVGESGNSR